MNPAIERFLERPASHKIAAGAVVLALLCFLFWQFLYSGEYQESVKLGEKVEALNTQIASERRLARNLKKFREEVKDLDGKLQEALKELPDSKEIPDLLSSVSNLARDSGLDVILIKPTGSENFKEFYAEVPYSVSVEGTFHQIATFFDEVGRMPRIVNINQISLRDPSIKDKIKIKADCLVTTFYFIEESERDKSRVDDSKTRRRRR
jgi:type IV pilus assembly protein PilO